MSKMWMNTGNIYDQVNSNYRISDNLPVGIYNIQLTKTGFHLEKYADKFIFYEKIYGLQDKFINHVLKTYNNTKGNLGVIFNGTKGTGKTYTAKELVNKLNLPTIIVQDMGDNNQAMVEFLSSIEADCVFFLDEFEKNFSERDSTVLQIMDGVYNTKFRKIFLLTTNSLNVNGNLLGRPSRIRYVRTFGNLELRIINEYLNDNLQVPEARQELIEYLDNLEISTIDILKTLVNEINIHGKECLNEIKQFFNVPSSIYNYNVVRAQIDMQEVLENKEKYSTKQFVNFIKSNPPEDEENDGSFSFVSKLIINHPASFDKLKVGDFFYGDMITAIDKKLRVIVTQDGSDLLYYLVKEAHNYHSMYCKNILSESLIV